jgi:hypothetical protein
MRDDRVVRAMLALVCLLIIVPWISGVAVQFTIYELRSSWERCKAGLKSLAGSLKHQDAGGL